MFSIGEFSRIARVSKRLLQFYDDEHLLRPAFIDRSNGYRHYGAQQLLELNRILVLKELGLPLADIRHILEGPITVGELRARLQSRRQLMERDLAVSLQRLRSLEARLDCESDPPDVVMKDFPAQMYLYRTTTLSPDMDSWTWVRQTAALLRSSLGRRAVETFMVTIPGDGFETRDATLEAGSTLTGDGFDVPEGFHLTELAPRPMTATVAQTGGPALLHTGCASIGRYIERHGLTMVGPPREAFLEWPVIHNCEDAVIESQFTVEPFVELAALP